MRGTITLTVALALCAPIARAQAPAEVVTWNSGVSYSYDGSGNVQQIGKDWFVYDHVGRLLQSNVNGILRNYEYDAYGNRTKCTQAVGTSEESDCQGFTIDSSRNQVVEAAYDPAGSGNLLSLNNAGHTYSYDAFNMMQRDQAAVTREFIYTAADERVAVYTTGNSSWQWTLRDLANKPLREFTSAGGAHGTQSFQWTKDYIWRESLLLASLQKSGAATTTYHYHLDHQGTPRRVTDRNDNMVSFRDYHPFGVQALGHNEASKINYTGHERDQASDAYGTLDYMHARYYNPMLGRFMTIDPSTAARANIPQSWNPYAYTRNNPLRFVDPDGLAEVDIHVYSAPAGTFYDAQWFAARLFGSERRMSRFGHHSFQYTDGRWAQQDLKRSLSTPGAFVIYFGHAAFTGRKAIGLDPVGRQQMKDVITTKQLTQMLSTAKAAVVLITGCSSAACVSPGMKSTAGAIVAIQPVGDKGTFASANYSALATDTFVNAMLGTNPNTDQVTPPATVGEAIDAANKNLEETDQPYRFVLIWGDPMTMLEPDKP